MIIVYFDASALAKRYAPEVGSELVDEVFNRLPISQLTCSTIGILEVVSILVRKGNDHRLPAQSYQRVTLEFDQEIIHNPAFQTVPLDDALLLSAINLIIKHNINASDALILRAALNLQTNLAKEDSLLFWCSDKRLIRAATAEGLATFDPEVKTVAELNTLLAHSN